jgi:predicted metal-dependent hydrolase
MFITQTHSPEVALAVKLADMDCPLELRRSRRARRFSLKVSHTERAAILTLPSQVNIEEAGEFLSRHMDWLKRQIERLPQPVPLLDGAVIPLRGVFHKVAFVGAVRYQGVVWLEETDNLAMAGGFWDEHWNKTAPNSQHAFCTKDKEKENEADDTRDFPRICVSGGESHGPRRLSDWLRTEAKADLSARVAHHAANLGVRPKRISIRDQSSRWGSCSTTGTISFSWRLIFAPSYVLDYVAAHEVAHLREMNHGPRFWRLVRDTMPDVQKARNWLKQKGTELHRFAVAD